MDDSSNLPLGILLLGLAMVAAFLAFRPWPVNKSAKPITTGAYLWETLEGHPPPPGPSGLNPNDVKGIELGLDTLAGIWALSKVASVMQAAGQSVSSILGELGKFGAGGAGGGFLGKAWGWIKGIFSKGEVEGEVPVE